MSNYAPISPSFGRFLLGRGPKALRPRVKDSQNMSQNSPAMGKGTQPSVILTTSSRPGAHGSRGLSDAYISYTCLCHAATARARRMHARRCDRIMQDSRGRGWRCSRAQAAAAATRKHALRAKHTGQIHTVGNCFLSSLGSARATRSVYSLVDRGASSTPVLVLTCRRRRSYSDT